MPCQKNVRFSRISKVVFGVLTEATNNDRWDVVWLHAGYPCLIHSLQQLTQYPQVTKWWISIQPSKSKGKYSPWRAFRDVFDRKVIVSNVAEHLLCPKPTSTDLTIITHHILLAPLQSSFCVYSQVQLRRLSHTELCNVSKVTEITREVSYQIHTTWLYSLSLWLLCAYCRGAMGRRDATGWKPSDEGPLV